MCFASHKRCRKQAGLNKPKTKGARVVKPHSPIDWISNRGQRLDSCLLDSATFCIGNNLPNPSSDYGWRGKDDHDVPYVTDTPQAHFLFGLAGHHHRTPGAQGMISHAETSLRASQDCMSHRSFARKPVTIPIGNALIERRPFILLNPGEAHRRDETGLAG